MISHLAPSPSRYIRGASNEYELGGTLGKGAYAKVKKAVETESGTVFAVKIFNKSLLKRRRMWDSTASRFKTAYDDVIREIAIMKRLDHENVMNMHDVIDDPTLNKLYMVMDCHKGAILESEDLPCEPVGFEDARRWFVDTAVGLEYLHFQGVVHFDLKPGNRITLA